VDIHGVEALRSIELNCNTITEGLLTTISDIEEADALKKYTPVLWQVAKGFADARTRISATIGGNIRNASPAADRLGPYPSAPLP